MADDVVIDDPGIQDIDAQIAALNAKRAARVTALEDPNRIAALGFYKAIADAYNGLKAINDIPKDGDTDQPGLSFYGNYYEFDDGIIKAAN